MGIAKAEDLARVRPAAGAGASRPGDRVVEDKVGIFSFKIPSVFPAQNATLWLLECFERQGSKMRLSQAVILDPKYWNHPTIAGSI